MQTTIWTRLKQSLLAARQWYEQTPERALDQAYAATLMIKSVEDEHFDGNPISVSTDKYGTNSNAVFQEELRKCLKIATLRLSEFKASRFVFNTTDASGNALQGPASLANKERSAIILEKLKFIDEVLARYQAQQSESLSLVPVEQNGKVQLTPSDKSQLTLRSNANTGSQRLSNGQTIDQLYQSESVPEDEGIFDKSGVLPRTIASTIGRIKRDLDPNSEQQVVRSFRSTKAKTQTAIRFMLILIAVPLLTEQISKALIVGPIVDSFRSPAVTEPFLNFELQEEALKELQTFKERLEFDFLLGKAPSLTSEVGGDRAGGESAVGEAAVGEGKATGEANKTFTKAEQEELIEGKLKERAEEIKLEYSHASSGAIKNIFADLFSVAAFAIVLLVSRREVAVLKSFIDDTVYGLSDSAKAFVIILLTDTFVGFHSPHGWEVLLEGLSNHWGLPANRDFIFLFIATFPVILDTIFKYWIFRYLNRISPSAVATYKNMNE
ncbi:proton extrusion protein PcxA [Stenomitos frigidus]|uniref:Proton extrusion protein PxcA n=1 Tax=Stenomitos frigidus ULC18 TaxID=2107698 RepID=A0A2T1E5Y8_9CYAN|nr:proton extrusion protein PcxA [Stenomitos frigidus]PSB28167.1 proton extrusion protein PcxA [Stenomitos frigidus ULC18]